MSEGVGEASHQRFLVCTCPMGVAEQSQGTATQGRHSLREDHVMVHGRQATQSKHPNQASKDICSNRVGSITYMFGFHRRKGGGGWTHLDHLSTCDSVLKLKESFTFPK